MGTSTTEGVKTFYKHYKKVNVRTVSDFFGVSKQMAYQIISKAKANIKSNTHREKEIMP